jgi:hypothetical protein
LFNFSEIENNIVKWIKDEQWYYRKNDEKDDIGVSNFHFVYNVTLKNGINVTIGIEKSIDRLNIQHKLDIADTLQKISNLSAKKYDFFYDLQLKIMLMDIHMAIDPSIEAIQSIYMAQFIYLDEFSRNKFINSIVKLGNAVFVCIMM